MLASFTALDGVGPSRIVGEALDFLLEIRVEDGEISEAARLAARRGFSRTLGHKPVTIVAVQRRS